MKLKIKIVIDFLMTVLLFILMAYQITGQELHEWFGAGMLVMFLIHNILNIRWYGNLFKGKYTMLRILQTVINFGVLISILFLGYSGIVMSQHVFVSRLFDGSLAAARKMHLAASYWSFVFISIHLGAHWNMILGVFGKVLGKRKLKAGEKRYAVCIWLVRIVAVVISGYGAYSFHKANIASYMLLENQFVFFNFNQSALSVFAEYIGMMGFFVFITFYAIQGIGTVLKRSRKNHEH